MIATKVKALFVVPVLLVHSAATADAQSIPGLRDAFREDITNINHVAGFQAIGLFAAAPGISGVNYEFGEDDNLGNSSAQIDVLKLPLRYEFSPLGRCGAINRPSSENNIQEISSPSSNAQRSADPAQRCIRPYGEIAFSYVRATETQVIDFLDNYEIDFDVTMTNALAGGGLTIPLTKRTMFRPILLLGYSHVQDDAETRGISADLIDPAAEGIYTNFEVNSLVFGGAAELSHQRRLTANSELDTHIRYSHVLVDSFRASDRSLESSNDFGVVSAGGEVDRKTGLKIYSRDLHLIGSLEGTYFPALIGEELGTDFLVGGGVGIEIKEDQVIRGVEGAQLFGRYIVGEDVTGYQVGLTLTF